MGEIILIDKLFFVHGMARACFLYQLPFLLFSVRWSFQIQHAIRGKTCIAKNCPWTLVLL